MPILGIKFLGINESVPRYMFAVPEFRTISKTSVSNIINTNSAQS